MKTDATIKKNHSSVRFLYGALGLTSTALGIIGAFLPVMPTTCFLLVALWAFSKSSPRLHAWLWNHKRFGRSLQRWTKYRVIPKEAKCAAVLSMTGSLLYLTFFVDVGTVGFALAAGGMAIGAYFVLRAPSEASGTATPASGKAPSSSIQTTRSSVRSPT